MIYGGMMMLNEYKLVVNGHINSKTHKKLQGDENGRESIWIIPVSLFAGGGERRLLC